MLYVVLNDGETYTAAEGCRIYDGPDDPDDFEEYLRDAEGWRSEYLGDVKLEAYRVRR